MLRTPRETPGDDRARHDRFIRDYCATAISQPITAFNTVMHDALLAEADQNLAGTYPPAGHGYPNRD